MYALVALLLLSQPAQAGIIRDAEIEHTLKDFSYPIFRTAGLKPSAVNIFMIQDNSLNAFVAGGANIFFYTGLIDKTEDPGEVIGVELTET